MNKPKSDRATAEESYERTQKAKAAVAVVSEQEAQVRAVDEKTARLKAMRLARDAAAVEPETKFKQAPRRKKQAAKNVSLTPEAKQQYEESAMKSIRPLRKKTSA